MTQNANLLPERMHTTQLAQELMNQEITLLALKDGTQISAQYLAQSLEEQGKRCSWVWFPDGADCNDGETGTAFLCLDRTIRAVDRFSLSNGSESGKQTVNTALGIQIEGMEDWFYCLSQDLSEDHPDQWKLLNGSIAGKWLCNTVWLLGIRPQWQGKPSGRWFAAADGKILCSRRREIRSYTGKHQEKSLPYTKGAAVIEVEE